MNEKKVVVSGIRATGFMHLGNYLGVLERFARMSEDPTLQCNLFIADLHTLTTHKKTGDTNEPTLRENARRIVADLLAAGVNPERAVLYAQSSIPSVTELMWYLSCLTPVGDLNRMPTFKDKAEKQPEDVNAGLYTYPVLMAADILGMRGELVPVGRDQKPHLEMARDLAQKFNRLFGEVFPLPDPMEDEMVLIPGLAMADKEGRHPKMGKSEAPEQTLFLHESADEMREKIRKSPTDPARARRTDPGTPQKCAVYWLHTHVSNEDRLTWCVQGCTSAAITCRECKDALATSVNTRLTTFRERRTALLASPDLVNDVLADGNRRAALVFNATVAEVADRMGVLRSNSI